MKKIVIFIDSLGSGGAQRRATNLAVLLKDKGYDIRIIIYIDDIFFGESILEKGIKIVYVESKNNFSRIINVRKEIDRFEPDVVISFMETPCFIAEILKMLSGKRKQHWRLITTESSSKKSTFLSQRGRLFNMFQRFSDIKVCNSENSRRMWEEFFPKYIDRYRVIYNPVIIPDEIVEGSNKVIKDTIHIVVAASYQGLKNPINVIKAIGLLSEQDRNRIHLDWYGRREIENGNSEIYQYAVELVEELSLSGIVSLHEETREIYSIMRDCDAVGIFSSVEGLPNTICEALTLGKIVIMTPVSDYQVLVDGNGYVCESDSVEDIKNGFEKICHTSDSDLQDMQNKSKDISRLFEPNMIIKQWVDVIECAGCEG